MVNPRIVILVIASEGGAYSKFKQTWLHFQNRANKLGLNVKIYFTYGKPGIKNKCILRNGHDLLCNVKDSPLKGVLQKTAISIEYCHKNFEFDYLVLSNLSTIIVPSRLSDYLSKQPSEKYFGGHIWYVGKSNETFSNWCVWTVSSDIVEYIVKHLSDFMNYRPCPADVASSKLVKRAFPITHILTNHGMYYNNGKLNNSQNPESEINKEAISARLFDLETFREDKNIFWIRARNKNRNLDIQLHSMVIGLFND